MCDKPEYGKIDTSCLLHKKELVYKFDWWKNRDEAGYAHDWEFVRPWVENNVRYVATLKPTVLYNKDTSGQKEFLENKLKGL